MRIYLKLNFLDLVLRVQVIKQFPKIEIEEYKEDKKINIAYSLLNSSNAMNDLRASF